MTISYAQLTDIGPRTYAPEGPLDTTGQSGPLPSFNYGTVVAGAAEGEFVYVKIAISGAPVTVNQGDLVTWDQNFNAALSTTTASIRGQSAGTFFIGGSFGNAANGPFTYVFPTNGTYGIWVQRAGISLVKCAATVGATNLAETTATAGQINAPASATVGSKLITGLYIPAASATFTANTTNGSPTLTNISTVTGIYPNQAVAGTGIPGSTTIVSINGNPGSYTITLSANATASGTAVTVTATGYLEGLLHWPYIDKTN